MFWCSWPYREIETSGFLCCMRSRIQTSSIPSSEPVVPAFWPVCIGPRKKASDSEFTAFVQNPANHDQPPTSVDSDPDTAFTAKEPSHKAQHDISWAEKHISQSFDCNNRAENVKENGVEIARDASKDGSRIPSASGSLSLSLPSANIAYPACLSLQSVGFPHRDLTFHSTTYRYLPHKWIRAECNSNRVHLWILRLVWLHIWVRSG
jgi:hypothetical protein